MVRDRTNQLFGNYLSRFLEAVTISVCHYKDGQYLDWDNSFKFTVRRWIDRESILLWIYL